MASEVAQQSPSGYLQVKGDRGSRTWYALWRDADGRHQKRLGLAHEEGADPTAPSVAGGAV